MNDMLERLTDGFPVKLMGGILFLTFEKQLAMLLLFCAAALGETNTPVSYTHLTLPTIRLV